MKAIQTIFTVFLVRCYVDLGNGQMHLKANDYKRSLLKLIKTIEMLLLLFLRLSL